MKHIALIIIALMFVPTATPLYPKGRQAYGGIKETPFLKREGGFCFNELRVNYLKLIVLQKGISCP